MTLSRARLLPFALTLVATLAVAAVAWVLSFNAALREVALRAEADLEQTSDRLIAQLQSYRELSVLLADHPEVEALLAADFLARDGMAVDGARARADALLLTMADTVGALRIAVFDDAGLQVAGSDMVREPAVRSLWTPALERAMTGALGRFAGVDGQAGRRSFGFASPVYAVPFTSPSGVIVVAANLETIDAEWRGEPSAVYFSDGRGEVLVSNRTELMGPRPGVGGGLIVDERRRGPYTLWAISDGGPYLPELALHLSRDLPVIGMSGAVLVDASPARQVALLQTVLAALVVLALGAIWLGAQARRDALARRLQEEERAKEVLEARVAERTTELVEINAALRHEVAERTAAEAELKATQDRLVQAGKLSALGEMSAGISHELNQPLMAIRSFAENAEMLLDQDRTEIVAQNLGRISELSRRMGRIIRNLRAFARQEDAPVHPVDPAAVIDAALEMVEARIRRTGVTLEWIRPVTPVRVMAGEVRLQQVVMNLVSNALDAMEATERPWLQVAVTEDGAEVCITVCDSGPGIAVPDRIFDPFYSTKEVGPTEGMGLGLSISYGLVQSFGGGIEGRNSEDGGAVFTVRLPRVAEDVAA